jgi:hypothetical protein
MNVSQLLLSPEEELFYSSELSYAVSPTAKILGFDSLEDYVDNFVKTDVRFTSGDCKKEDFYFKTSRAVSAGIVSKGYSNCTEFSVEVLMPIVPMFKHLTIFNDHWSHSTAVSVGIVLDAFWEDAYTDANGLKVPEGINVVYMIDQRTAAGKETADKIKSYQTKYLSFTPFMEYRQSHTFESRWEFYEKVGTKYTTEGGASEYVRYVTTNIKRLKELSFVVYPADAYASIKDADGKLIANASREFLTTYSSAFNPLKNKVEENVASKRESSVSLRHKNLKMTFDFKSITYTVPEGGVTETVLGEVVAAYEAKIAELAANAETNAFNALVAEFEATFTEEEKAVDGFSEMIQLYTTADRQISKNRMEAAILSHKQATVSKFTADLKCVGCGAAYSNQSSATSGGGENNSNSSSQDILDIIEERLGS